MAKLDKRPLGDVTEQIHRLAQLSATDFGNTFSRNAKLDPKLPNNAKFATDGARAGKAFSDGFNAAARKGAANSNRVFKELSDGVSKIGESARSFAVAGAAPALLAMGAAAVTAAGAIGVLPGIMAAASAGVGTLVLGLQGFGDAIKDMGDPKKFAQDLQSLAPAAQQTALEFKKLVDGPLGDLKKATQESLFSGMAEEVHNLANVLLPSVRTATTGIASAFNGMAKGAMDQLMKPETAAALDSTLRNVTQAFQNAAPAAAPFVKALTDIAQVGSSFLPGFAQSLTNGANAFAQFITHARDTGQLSGWIRDGVDMIRQLASITWDVIQAIGALLPIAQQVFPYVRDAIHEVSDLLREHPGLIWGVVGAFAAWKSISGVAALITSLSTVRAALMGLPAVAGTAAAGISAALSKIALPAWIAWMIGKEHDKDPTQQKANEAVHNNDLKGFLSDLQGGGGTFLPPGPGPDTRTPQEIHDQNRQRRMGLPGGAPLPPNVAGWDEYLPQNAGLSPWQPSAVPGVPASGGGKAERTHGPEVPYSGDPMALIQGYQATSALYGAAGSLLDKQHQVEQLRADLNKMAAENTATEDELTKKRNELAIAQREQHEAEIRLDEAKLAQSQKLNKGLSDLHDGMGHISAGLDKDLGFSKGLPGLADNLVRFLGALATAPLKALLDPIAKQGDGSYGLLGMMFGGSAKDRQAANYPGVQGYSGMSGYPGDAALLANVRPGRYSQAADRDLLKGLSDCSSSIGDLVNIMDGRSTSGQKLTTGNAADWLPSHGFTPGMGGPGDFRVGYNGGHMQATLPGGTPWNWGSDAAAARGGVGGTGAFDPAFTDHYYRPAGSGGQYAPTPGPITPPALATPAPPLPAIANSGNILPPLTNPNTSGLSMPGAPAGGPLNTGMPKGLPTTPLGPVAPYTAQSMPQAQQGWQPQGGGGIGIGGGLMGAAMSAASMGADMFAPGSGAAAQMAMKLMDRGIKFGGQLAGIATEGILSTFAPSNPDSGASPLKDSWLWRAAGALAGATPALGSGGAAMLDKMSQQKQAEDQGQQAQQQGQQGQQSPAQSGPLVNIEQWNAGDRSGKSNAMDVAATLSAQNLLPR